MSNIHSFLGLAGYHRSFVKDFATMAKPLSSAAEKDRRFTWTTECEEVFETLKTCLMSSPVLAYLVPEGQLVLDMDASLYGLGAVLSQEQSGVARVLAYASRTLTRPERNYCVTRPELLVVIFGLKKFGRMVERRMPPSYPASGCRARGY